MQTKHTPTPWKFERRGDSSARAAIEHNIPLEDYPFAVWIPSPPFVLGAIGMLIAKTDGLHSSSDECEANARLIAAAPELLEALQTLAAYANGRLDKNPYRIPEYKQALCAIGKATGKNTDGDAWMDANNEAYTTHAKATGR